MNKCKM